MKTVSAREANQSFSRLLQEAEAGEEVVVTRRGKPVARIVPATVRSEAERRKAREELLELLREGRRLGYSMPATRDEMHER